MIKVVYWHVCSGWLRHVFWNGWSISYIIYWWISVTYIYNYWEMIGILSF